jgi:hypothetical protein
MSNHPTSKDLPSVISSPESEDGAEHLSLQDGAQSDLFGQEAHRANLFQMQVVGRENRTPNDISGRSSSISLRSADLQQSLGSKLASAIRFGWLDDLQTDLETEDYAAAAVVLPSGGIGAPHKRERLFFVADSLSQGLQGHGQSGQEQVSQERQRKERHSAEGGLRHSSVGDSKCFNDFPCEYGAASCFWDNSTIIHCRDGKYRPIPTEPALFPLANGLSNRVGILRGAGNAIVPQAAAEIIKAFMETYIKLE